MSITKYDNVSPADVSDAFLNGIVVFKIKANRQDIEWDVHMVVSKNDYLKKVKTHQYTPLLYTIPLCTRLAYLYGCLNRKYETPRDETFTFWWRKCGENDWYKWFIVEPYIETHNGVNKVSISADELFTL